MRCTGLGWTSATAPARGCVDAVAMAATAAVGVVTHAVSVAVAVCVTSPATVNSRWMTCCNCNCSRRCARRSGRGLWIHRRVLRSDSSSPTRIWM